MSRARRAVSPAARTPAASIAADLGRGIAVTAPRRVALLAACVVLAAGVALASVFLGSGDIPPSEVWRALTTGGEDTNAILVTEFRVPRTLLGLLVGAGLGMAGALMQAVTRNPLAEPGILGVNAGAFFTVVVAVAAFDATAPSGYVWWAFLGALGATVLVYLIAGRSRGGATPVRLLLAGVALGYVLTGISYGITLLNPEVFDRIRFWVAGSLQGRQFDVVVAVAPFLVVGLVAALLLPRSLNAMALGDDLARALGVHVGRTRVVALLVLTVLCGAATAAAGPITFVGLMVPYIARAFVGPDNRWIFVFTLALAPSIFLGADVIGRHIASGELPVGIVSAFVGAPVLIVLIRRYRMAGL